LREEKSKRNYLKDYKKGLMEQRRNERGQFAKETTVFQAEKPRLSEYRASQPHITHVTLDDRIESVRQELSTIQSIAPEPEPTILQLPEVKGGEATVLEEKVMKKRIIKAKETSPKSYKDKLLVIADLQLLHETNEEGVGALVAYIKDQGRSFTHVVLNGDIVDLAQQSGFRKSNEDGDQVTIDEIEAGKWFIGLIEEEMPNAKKVYNFGNHEARYASLYLDSNNGIKQYLRPLEEMLGIEDWEVHQYGNGDSYNWNGRLIRHGTKSGCVMNIPKIEMERNWRPNTIGHAITNRMWEFVDGEGNSYRSYVHAGFSRVAAYDRTGDKKPSNGFGIYYHAEVKGKAVDTEYQVIFPANNPRFISPEGTLYDGSDFNLREEIGLDPKRGRGRPRKIFK
jgi:hypothetical protein